MLEKQTISSKIETMVETFLRFFVKLGRTSIVFLFVPWRAHRKFLGPKETQEKFLKPLTFLVVGGYLFGIIIDTYPVGFSGLFDLVWFEEEIRVNISDRWQEALSISRLLLAGLPILFTVTALSSLVSMVAFRKPDTRKEFFNLSCFAFGYQSIMFFLFLNITLGFEVFEQLFKFEFSSLSGNFLAETLFIGGLIFLALSAFFSPLIALSAWALPKFGTRNWVLKIGAVFLLLFYSFGTLYVYSYSASIPAVLVNLLVPPPQPSLIVLEHPNIEKAADSLDVKSKVIISFPLVVDNPESEEMLIEAGSISLRFWREEPNNEFGDIGWGSTENRIIFNEKTVDFLKAPKQSITYFWIESEFDLPEKFVEELKVRFARDGALNEPAYYLTITISPRLGGFRMEVDYPLNDSEAFHLN